MAVGVCRFCGQYRTVQFAEGKTQGDLDEIATSECSCEGAEMERKIQYMKSKANTAIEKIIIGRYESTGKAMQAILDDMARGRIKTFQVAEADGVKSSMRLTKSGIEVQLAETIITTVEDA